jgi:hypothetical protein
MLNKRPSQESLFYTITLVAAAPPLPVAAAAAVMTAAAVGSSSSSSSRSSSQGIRGPAGPSCTHYHDTCTTGLQHGTPGCKGDPGIGIQGPIGLRGLKGDKGDKGDQGIRGEHGCSSSSSSSSIHVYPLLYVICCFISSYY